MLGTIEQGRLSLAEIHRFPNGPMRLAGSLRWNIAAIFEELKLGMKAVSARGIRAESVSVDSWGVDLVWFNDSEPMLALPYHYRDSRTDKAFPAFCEKATRKSIFGETGIQFMPFNSLFQIADDVARRPEVLAAASSFLRVLRAWERC
jgi:rhamnulokinase